MTTARARARQALTEEIKEAARRQIAAKGAAALSLRAVARELGMVSSALYRYFASRDELLTALIVDAYDAIGAVAEASTSTTGGFARRWQALAGAIRSWALANPHDFALAYGSPVPGYRAPADTIAPAQRSAFAALSLVVDAVAAGEVDTT
jgi:AcrR family transcriptional regulator